MKKFKKKYFFMLCLPLVIAGSILSVVLLNNQQNKGLKHEFIVDMSQRNYRKVYLLDENQFLIPLSIDVSSKEYLVDEIYTIVSDLRDLKIEGFTPTLPSEVKINKIELENGILNIDFSNEFLTYEADLEEKIIESLTWSVLDFKEVEGLTISVEGVKIDKMPVNGLKLPSVLNKDIGINKYHDLTTNFMGSDDVVVLYQKTIGEQTYYVPVTRRVVKEDNETMTIINALDTDIGLLSGLRPLKSMKNLLKNHFEYNEASVNVSLTKDYLIDDNLIDAEVYEILMVTFLYNQLDTKVNFFIDEESVGVSGYLASEGEEVSDIIFNEVKI